MYNSHLPTPLPCHAQVDLKFTVILLTQFPSARITVLSHSPWLLSFLMDTIIYEEQGCAISKIIQGWNTHPCEEFGCFSEVLKQAQDKPPSPGDVGGGVA